MEGEWCVRFGRKCRRKNDEGYEWGIYPSDDQQRSFSEPGRSLVLRLETKNISGAIITWVKLLQRLHQI